MSVVAMNDEELTAAYDLAKRASSAHERDFVNELGAALDRALDEITEGRRNNVREARENASAAQRGIMEDVQRIKDLEARLAAPIPMILTCPSCNTRHIDTGVFASKPHHTHACQHCGMVWRPAVESTIGVQFLPGFKDV